MELTNPTNQEFNDKVSDLEAKLAKTEWLHGPEAVSETKPYAPFYGDVTELNTDRTILDNVGKETLHILTSDLMDLLQTSVAIYEKNGDYAYGEFDSAWCQLLDASSRKLCDTDDNKAALSCGKWLCHEDCWLASKKSIEKKDGTTISCSGAIKLYAEPIFMDNEVIGSINIGLGNPPTNNKTLKELSEKYSIDFETLKQKAVNYNPRPDFIIEIAKKRLKSVAKLIGEMVSRKQTEEKLRESEEKFRKIFQYASIGITIISLDGKFVSVNNSLCNFLGYSKDELLQKTFQEITYPDDLQTDLNYVREMLEKKRETYQMEKRYIHKTGKIIHGLLNVSMMSDLEGEPIYFISQIVDISKRKKTEHALKESENNFKSIVENSSNTFYKHDTNHILTYFSPQVKNLLGYDVEEAKRKWTEFVTDNPINEIGFEKTVKAIETGKSQGQYDSELKHKDGHTIWVEVRETPIVENGETVEIVGALIDVTEQRKMERLLKESEEKFRVLVENTSDWIWEIDIDGNFTYVSPQIKNMLGYIPAEIMGKNAFDLMSPEEAKKVEIEYTKYVENKSAFKGMINVNLHKNGNEVVIESSGEPIIDNKGTLIGYRGIDRDITDRKNAEQKIQEYARELEEANATKDKFFNIVAHDLRNPFSTILGFSNLLKDNVHTYEKEKIYQFVDNINNSTEKTFKLLENLLEWSRAQTGNIIFNSEELILENVVIDVIKQNTDLATAKGITLDYRISSPITIFSDRNMLNTIFRNLITNAIKFTNEGGKVTISGTRNEKETLIEISDNGIGMSEETLSKLFKIGEKVSRVGTVEEKGTGLGLLICKEFVGNHGGEIRAESEEGKGSTFFFTIPN